MPRITAYQQLEHSDCGITCIRIIAKYYGREIPLKTLRELCDMGRMGISMRDITGCLERLGFKAAAVRVGIKDALRMPLPAILYWDQRHFVVLYRISKDGGTFYLADPAQGKVRLSQEDFLRHWRSHEDGVGLAAVMDPTDAFYEKEYEHQTGWCRGLLRMMRRTVSDHRRGFAAVILLTLVSMAGDVVLPIIFQRTIDDGISGRDIPLVWMLVGSQLLVFIGNYVAGNAAELVLTRMGLRMSIRMVNDYLGRLIRLPIAFFDRKVNSDLIQKLDDQNRIKSFLVSMPETIFFTVANLLVFSGMLIYYSPLVFLVFLVATGLSFLWTRLHLRRRKAIDYAFFSYSSENRNNVYELISGMPEIKINNAQTTRVAVWREVQEKINRLSMRSALLGLSIGAGNTFLSRLKDILITGICATMVIRSRMTIGEMMTISYVAGRLTGPFSNIVEAAGTVQDAAMSYERIDEIMSGPLDERPEEVVSGDDVSIRFDDVSFKYPGSYAPYVIRHLTACIPQGKTTALVGASGCGKTTLIKLMLGFYVPQEGHVFVGQDDMGNLDREDWLRYCGVVMQSGYVFSGTILDNIALSSERPDLERARSAARVACIDDFFDSLPMGYHTKLGVAGVELSGGQRQRLLIARAVYKNPRVLFLDEATSSLDANNEAAIVRHLAEYNEGRTVVVAAHRLSTVRHADNIIYMEHGEIVESGTHEQLVTLRGAYYRLVREQLDLEK